MQWYFLLQGTYMSVPVIINLTVIWNYDNVKINVHEEKVFSVKSYHYVICYLVFSTFAHPPYI